tara:strand:+ start:141 stop:311 length:171 start_codon:yes stop_codon:yes gene_type:complete
MKKNKYLIIGFILGWLTVACEDWNLMADYDEQGNAIRGSVEYKPLYVYVVNGGCDE